MSLQQQPSKIAFMETKATEEGVTSEYSCSAPVVQSWKPALVPVIETGQLGADAIAQTWLIDSRGGIQLRISL